MSVELNNGFFDLNESVRQTNQTFLDVLGPMANQLKEKLAKELSQAATDQDNTTSSLEDSYNKINAADAIQQELFRQQLQRRGYDIDQNGKEIKTTQELSISQQEQLDKLDKRIEKENKLLQATDKPVQSFRQLASSTNSIGSIFNLVEDKMFKITGKSVGGAMALQSTISAVTGITKAFSEVTDSIYKGERGSEVSARGFKEFSGELTKAAYGIAGALMVLPLGPVAKIASVAIALAAAAVERATKMMEAGAKINNDLYKSYNALSEKGLTTAKGMSGLNASLQNIGFAASDIDKFNQLLGDNSKNLALFGGTAATGLTKFEKVANALAAPTSELNKELLLMGITSDAQREHIMKYMTEEERLGLSKDLSDQQNIQGAKRYMENLDKLSMLTGNNRKELEEARATVMANENLRAAIFDAEQDKSEAGKLRLAELKRAYETAAMLQATGDTKGATGIAEYFAGRGITGKASAVAYNQFSGKGGLIEGIKKGASSAELTTRAASGYQRQADIMSTTGRFGGDTSGLMTGGFAQSQEYITRSAELRKKAKDAGYGEDVTAYIEAEQKAKKETTDKTTQQNAEVIQSQQKTAQILDKANLAIYEIAANVMNPAMKDFEKATDLFAQAVGIKSKKKEEPAQKAPAPTETIKPRPKDNLKAQVWDAKYAKGWNADGTPKSTTKSEPTTQASLRAIDNAAEAASLTPTSSPAPTQASLRAIDNAAAAAASAPVPSGGTSAPQPSTPPTTTESPTRSLPKTLENIFSFGNRSGSKTNFDALSASFKDKIIAAAQAFNSATGSKIKINSAKRDSADQQRIWDESVAAGRPGRTASGMPIGKPGRSKHERGLAVDIQNYEDPKAVAAMNRQGLFQTVPNDPVHFEAANTGAMFAGPTEGYFVQLHGKEFVGNQEQLNAIKKLIDFVEEKQAISNNSLGLSAMGTESGEDNSYILEKFTSMLESKTDELLEKIKFGNRVDSDLLNYSQG
jgi:hypothetical protein